MVAAVSDAGALWPLALYFGLVVVVVAAILVIAYVLGERHHRDTVSGQPYESGIMGTGSARQRLSVKFYLVAIFFVVFDLEAAFIYAWAVAARELGWPAYVAIVVFIGLLLVALAYLWKLGALDWGSAARQKQDRQEEAQR